MMLWLTLSSASAESLLYTEERSTAFEDVVVSDDQQWVAFGTGSTGQIHLLDVDSWTFTTMDVCAGALGALRFDEQNDLYAGCDDTGILQIDPQTGMVQNTIAVDATGFYFSSLYAGNLYVLAENPNGGNPRVHLIDLQQATEQDSGNFPTTLGYGAPKDMERVGNFLVVAHGSTSISKIDPVSGGATRDQQGPTTGSCEDVLPEENASNALISGGTAGVYRFLYSSNQLQFAGMGADLDQVSALLSHQGELWVADSGTDSLKAFTYNAGGATMGTETLIEVPLDINDNIQEMVSVQGYVIAGTDGGAVVVVGDGPWVEAEEPVPSVIEDQDSFTVSFTSSEAGSYAIRLQASANDDGLVIASGTVEAEETIVENLEITDDFIEGDNTVRIVVSSTDGEGHDAVHVTIDTPPTTPVLTSREVGFGDESILLSGTAITDSDLAYYQVYLSTEMFLASDYPEGGPVWDIHTEQELQIDLEPDADYDWSISGLNNEQVYYIALRAFDEGGKYSPMSAVQSVTPKDTLSASQLAGETGGFCGVVTQMEWWTIGLGTFLIVRRRRVGS